MKNLWNRFVSVVMAWEQHPAMKSNWYLRHMGVVLLYAYRASYFLFLQHKNTSELYIISSRNLNEYLPEVVLSSVILCLVLTKYFCCQKIKLFSVQNTMFHEQGLLNTALRLNIIRILCTIPCSMARALNLQPPKHTCTLQSITQTNIE